MVCKWNYFIRADKKDTPVQFGNHTTIESVYKSLNAEQKLIRIQKNNPKKVHVFKPQGLFRVWEILPLV